MYSKREIDLIIKGITDHIDSKDTAQDEKLDKILAQTTKTNGRVNKLENWQSVLIGGYAVFTGFLLPILGYTYFQQQEILKEDIIKNQEEILHNHEEITKLIK